MKLPSERYLKPIGTWAWATDSRGPCLNRDIRPDGLQKCLATSAVLRLCVLGSLLQFIIIQFIIVIIQFIINAKFINVWTLKYWLKF